MNPRALRVERFVAGWCLLTGGLLAAATLKAVDIAPNERRNVVVSPPSPDQIVVPEQYRGIHEVVPYPILGIPAREQPVPKPYQADFTAQYCAGFLRAWQHFLERFQDGAFDLDEATNPERFRSDFIELVQTGGPSAYPPGQEAGALACRDELLALAMKCHLTFLPARTPWLKKFIFLGGSDPGLNEAGNPRGIYWYTTQGRKIRDDDLELLREVSLADLERLSLTFTELTDAGFASLPPMPKLTHLELTGTSLTGACFRALDRFPRLVNLEIVGPRAATAEDLAAMQKLSALESVNLCAVEIGDDVIPVFLALPKLTDLRLDWAYDRSRGAKLSSGALAKLGGCSRLRVLGLSGCAVDDAALRTIAKGLPDLVSLSLAGTLVTNESIGSIQKLSKLEWLRLSHSRVTDVGIAALASHPAIKTLLLDDTKISDQVLVTLGTLPKIKEICVRRGQFSEAAIAAFKQAKPGAYVMQYTD